MESNKKTETTETNFKNALRKSWLDEWKGERPAPEVTIELLKTHEHIAKLSEAKKREREENGRK
jgi:5-hydroxyisourate hydrolase-like protein (transthyretin family)